eukprot:TRINITY_DN6710_c0_g1_i9.p2 TRINITY_DN6710_c0_g1~~TRINITY_DN6710_c0_g1_i9.p2  ORF type:complete len:256 (+),score=-27.17 TRINITY_DN6710_c0_g1_i9:245-1012(+)
MVHCNFIILLDYFDQGYLILLFLDSNSLQYHNIVYIVVIQYYIIIQKLQQCVIVIQQFCNLQYEFLNDIIYLNLFYSEQYILRTIFEYNILKHLSRIYMYFIFYIILNTYSRIIIVITYQVTLILIYTGNFVQLLVQLPQIDFLLQLPDQKFLVQIYQYFISSTIIIPSIRKYFWDQCEFIRILLFLGRLHYIACCPKILAFSSYLGALQTVVVDSILLLFLKNNINYFLHYKIECQQYSSPFIMHLMHIIKINP